MQGASAAVSARFQDALAKPRRADVIHAVASLCLEASSSFSPIRSNQSTNAVASPTVIDDFDVVERQQ